MKKTISFLDNEQAVKIARQQKRNILSPVDELQDKYRATLVGVHIGDAIGAPYETWTPKAIAEDIEARDGLHFFDYENPWAKEAGHPGSKMMPAGRSTDDSDQTADLAYSLIECNGLNPEHLREALCNSVWNNVSRLWRGKAVGSGGTTRNALSQTPARVQRGLSNSIGTNGSLMRCSPVALLLASYLLDLSNGGLFDSAKKNTGRKIVNDMSSVTHAHPHSKDACWIYTIVLSSLLAGNNAEIALADTLIVDPDLSECEVWIRVFSRLRDKNDFPYDPGAWPMRGTAEFSLYVALYALIKSESFAHGTEIAVRVGGDTDTYAAIAGGLLGAYYGYESIPEDWKDTILGHSQMIKYADALYQNRM